MRLCGHCIEKILKSKESGGNHRCFVDLEKGAQWTAPVLKRNLKATEQNEKLVSCLFCSTLRDDVSTTAPHLKDHNEPTHRWTIRSLSRIRESLETVVVTFHPLPNLPLAEGDTGKRAKLPRRTFFLFPEEALHPWPTPAQIGESTNPGKNGGAQIQAWLSNCDKTHTGCMKRRKGTRTSSNFVPTRLLDIRGPPGSNLKVIETGKTIIRSPYATLSHCWGKKHFVCLLPGNEKHFIMEGVPWQLLTTNFKEAVEVARFLEIEYIWIDSLCIIQGEDGDFKTEGAKMHSVYRNSYCNIAIADSMDSEGGAFRNRDSEDVVPVRYQPGPQEESAMFGDRVWRVVPSDLYESELLRTGLYMRGWVFQERMLAPRSLHFANRQIFWDCASLSACESLPFGLPPPMDGPARLDRHWRGRLQEREEQSDNDPLMEFWKSAVRTYTNCALTNGEDKLIALWGIAKIVRDGLGDEYGMGLWEQNIEDQLAWRVTECTLDERPTDSTIWGIARKFPTWSWASMDGRIEIPDRLSKNNKTHWTVKDHAGRNLKFDLVGVKRSAVLPTRLADATSSVQRRGMSDTIVEQKARYRVSSMKMDSKATNTVAEEVNRDDQPIFYSTSLPLVGHVGQARMEKTPDEKGWLLKPRGFFGDNIEAYPDTIPKQNSARGQNSLFVVLSAKQYVDSAGLDDEGSDEEESDEDNSPDERVLTERYDVSGLGILLKDVGDGHFHRTGAFFFHRISVENWGILVEPEETKFWLD